MDEDAYDDYYDGNAEDSEDKEAEDYEDEDAEDYDDDELKMTITEPTTTMKKPRMIRVAKGPHP